MGRVVTAAPIAGFGVRPAGTDVWLPGVSDDRQHWVLAASEDVRGLCGQLALGLGWSGANWRRWPQCPACRLAQAAE